MVFGVAWPFVYAYFKAEEWRWWISGLRIGGVSVESKLESDALLDLYWKVVGWYALLFIAFLIVIGGAVALTITAGGITGAELAAPGGIMKAIPLLVVIVDRLPGAGAVAERRGPPLSVARRLGAGAGDYRGHQHCGRSRRRRQGRACQRGRRGHRGRP